MFKFFSIFGLVAGLAGPAFAADIPARLVTKAPAAPAPFTWTGFYVGGNVGGAWGDSSSSYANPFTGPGNTFATCGSPSGVAPLSATSPNPHDLSVGCSKTPTSLIGGGQIGYNLQVGAWVYGIEADGAWQKLKDRSYVRFGNNPVSGAPMGSVAGDTAYLSSERNGLGTVRGRIGYAPGSWLLYATGGLAIGDVKHSLTEVLSPGNGCVTAFGIGCRGTNGSDTKVGWTVGGGIEYAFSREWSVGAEYLYVDLGSTTLTMPPGTGYFTGAATAHFDDREHIARVKINYHFGGPIVPRF